MRHLGWVCGTGCAFVLLLIGVPVARQFLHLPQFTEHGTAGWNSMPCTVR